MIIQSLIVFVTAVLAGSALFLIRNLSGSWLKMMLAFSGAFLIGITFMLLVPEVFHYHIHYLGLFVIAGFLMQLLLEWLTAGAEHGHDHSHSHPAMISPFLLLTGLCIHAFIEGLPIPSAATKELQYSLVAGIVVHNIPISLVLTGLFLQYGCSRVRALVYLAVFALMTPLGSLLGMWLQSEAVERIETIFPYTMALVIGIFLHVSTSILFEAEENHRYNLRKFAVVIAGLAIAFLVSLMGHTH